MSTTTSRPRVLLLPFPAAAAEAAIREALASNAADQGAIFDVQGSSWEPIVDSLVAMEALISLEKAVGIVLKETVVPRGGYDDPETCVSDLLEKARDAWAKKHGGI